MSDKRAEFREPPLRKESEHGAIEVVLCVSHDLPTKADAVALLHWQAAQLRELANFLDFIAQNPGCN